MKHQANAVCFAVMALALSAVGCDLKAPKGFPNTVPFTVIVTSESKPVADAVVQLISKDSKNALSVTGRTGADGTAAVQTIQGSYTRPGAPVGSYTVTVSKEVNVSSMTTVERDGSQDKAMAYAAEVRRLQEENPSEVPRFMNGAELSPITADVTKNGKLKIEITDYPEPEE